MAWLNRLMQCIVIGLLMFEIDLIYQFICTLGQVQKRGWLNRLMRCIIIGLLMVC